MTALHEEPLFKRQKDALDQITHLMEACNRRFSFQNLDLAERYVKGWLTLYIHLRVGRTGRELIVFAHSFNGEELGFVSLDDEVLTVSGTDYKEGAIIDGDLTQNHPLASRDGMQAGMLIVSVKLMDRPEQIVPTLVWSKLPDHVHGVGGQVFCFSGDLSFENIDALPEGKISPISPSGILFGDFTHEIVEGTAEVVANFASEYRQRSCVPGPQPEAPDALALVEIQLARNVISVRVKERFDFPVEVLNLGFGPVDLGLGYREALEGCVGRNRHNQ